jgi:hypothetical protein
VPAASSRACEGPRWRRLSPRAAGWSSLRQVNYDFRFKNAMGEWESVGHHKGDDRAAAFDGLIKRNGGEMPAGRYMSRPRGRQRDWDLFSLDREGNISLAAGAGSSETAPDAAWEG